MPFAATWMDLQIIILREVSQTEKDKQHAISLICEIFKKKNDTSEYIYKAEKKLTETQKTNFGYQRGKDTDGGDKLGVWD